MCPSEMPTPRELVEVKVVGDSDSGHQSKIGSLINAYVFWARS